MTDLQDLMAQRDALDKKITEIRQQERSAALKQALALIADYGLSQQDLFGAARSAQKATPASKVPAKYRDPETGKEWSGRGIAPKWLQGKDREQFLIAS